MVKGFENVDMAIPLTRPVACLSIFLFFSVLFQLVLVSKFCSVLSLLCLLSPSSSSSFSPPFIIFIV